MKGQYTFLNRKDEQLIHLETFSRLIYLRLEPLSEASHVTYFAPGIDGGLGSSLGSPFSYQLLNPKLINIQK